MVAFYPRLFWSGIGGGARRIATGFILKKLFLQNDVDDYVGLDDCTVISTVYRRLSGKIFPLAFDFLCIGVFRYFKLPVGTVEDSGVARS